MFGWINPEREPLRRSRGFRFLQSMIGAIVLLLPTLPWNHQQTQRSQDDRCVGGDVQSRSNTAIDPRSVTPVARRPASKSAVQSSPMVPSWLESLVPPDAMQGFLCGDSEATAT